jgi:AcrR family transcriptional regulator
MSKPELTKMHIAHTFVELARVNGINQVTISKIINSSGVSRGTFYYHFDSKADLFNYIFDEGFRNFVKSRGGKWPGDLCDLGLYLSSERVLFRKLIEQANERDLLVSHIRDFILSYMVEMYESLHIEKQLPEQAVFQLLNSLAYYAYNQIVNKALSNQYEKGAIYLKRYRNLFPHLIRFIIDYYWDSNVTQE